MRRDESPKRKPIKLPNALEPNPSGYVLPTKEVSIYNSTANLNYLLLEIRGLHNVSDEEKDHLSRDLSQIFESSAVQLNSESYELIVLSVATVFAHVSKNENLQRDLGLPRFWFKKADLENLDYVTLIQRLALTESHHKQMLFLHIYKFQEGTLFLKHRVQPKHDLPGGDNEYLLLRNSLFPKLQYRKVKRVPYHQPDTCLRCRSTHQSNDVLEIYNDEFAGCILSKIEREVMECLDYSPVFLESQRSKVESMICDPTSIFQDYALSIDQFPTGIDHANRKTFAIRFLYKRIL